MKESLFSLNERVALITGGSGDIGFAISKAFLEAGATVIMAGLDVSELNQRKASIKLPSERLFTFPVDVADSDQVDAMVGEITRKHEKIDILVTSAGIQHRSPAVDFDKTAWNKVIGVNLNGTFYCAKAVGRGMIERRYGKIIMITSLTSEIGIPGISAYAASRGGITQLSKTLAVEWAQYGINVNCIGPGRFKTRMTEDLFADETKYAKILNVIPMGRPGIPSDLAGVSVFLASEASGYITGQSIYVDGGWLAGGGNLLG